MAVYHYINNIKNSHLNSQPFVYELLQTNAFTQDIEAKKEAQKEKEIDEQEANASTMHRCRTMLDKDLINTGIYESAGKQSLPLVQLVQQLLRYLLLSDHFTVHTINEMILVSVSPVLV